MGLGLLARQGDGEASGLVLATLQQLGHRHPIIIARQRATLQARQSQQVLHQMLHALSLLSHQFQVALALILFEWQVLQRLDKPGQHSQGRANFMRDVGNKVTTHGFSLLECRHITGQQQLAPLAIAVELN